MTANPHPLAALADRVEQATEPSRELDAEIALAIGWRKYRPESSDLRHAEMWHDASGAPRQYLPRFTASIDDALTLVPPGMHARINTYGDECEVIGENQKHKSYWTCFYEGRNHGREQEDVAKAAMSLVAAILRARAAAAGGERG